MKIQKRLSDIWISCEELALNAGVAFAYGTYAAYRMGLDPKALGTMFVVQEVSKFAFNLLASTLGEKLELKNSDIKKIEAYSGLAIDAIYVAGNLYVNYLNPLGAVVISAWYISRFVIKLKAANGSVTSPENYPFTGKNWNKGVVS